MPSGTKKVRELRAGDLVKVGNGWREVIDNVSNGDGTYSLGLEGAPPVNWGSEMVFDVRQKPVGDVLEQLYGPSAVEGLRGLFR